MVAEGRKSEGDVAQSSGEACRWNLHGPGTATTWAFRGQVDRWYASFNIFQEQSEEEIGGPGGKKWPWESENDNLVYLNMRITRKKKRNGGPQELPFMDFITHTGTHHIDLHKYGPYCECCYTKSWASCGIFQRNLDHIQFSPYMALETDPSSKKS